MLLLKVISILSKVAKTRLLKAAIANPAKVEKMNKRSAAKQEALRKHADVLRMIAFREQMDTASKTMKMNMQAIKVLNLAAKLDDLV